ncbi:heavy metal translocatin [Coccomyxa subellipsoidea C-169]|uniref:Heavy metal translocatin n=1 Tax=Coccomyxa subellipsoidea (strain C-169) TaxID=574566 RepID=I0YRC7_COCSC|nr:heavy metal translocatin [Coccomyxa subellipsoidea C-169]EIE20946.1 heavy metal translocatin [Coccomyxa subellipsoidea C-169]|eukprot:XP_005645490.1 heavy metal translocatin [Coccomyxa subellipsoidea C-169]
MTGAPKLPSAASSALGQLGKPLEPGFDGGSGAHGSGGTGSGGSGGGGGEGGAGGSGPGVPEAEQHVGQVGGCAPAEDVVLLEVGGMHCASCSGRVRRLLEAQPHVTSASVSLTTETALVRIGIPALPLTGGPAGGALEAARSSFVAETVAHLAKVLREGGFQAGLRDGASMAAGAADEVVAAKQAERRAQLREATRRLIVAGLLASACFTGHIAHFFPSVPGWVRLLGTPQVHGLMSAAALLGPGREVLVAGWRSAAAGSPDMNTLVGLGASAAFGVSCVAAALPALGWRTFFEEPAMLLGVVLLGRTLERRAKLQASADMAALRGLLPATVRLAVGNRQGWSTVPAEAVQPGALLVVLPGDRLPVDGVVVEGTSTLDESALTGEPLPVTRGPGSAVAAGAVNCEGRITVRAVRCGNATAVADIVRAVEAAQARAAPVQRLADIVAGRFAVGVLGLSAATFAFWALAAPRYMPQVIARHASTAAGGSGAALLLAAQLACNVLVVACPCALGLAAPTAVLVGTSQGARRGLLIRGGDVLEAASRIDSVIFDKTGTLTRGQPVVTEVQLAPGCALEPAHVLSLAAALERESSHPIARAITEAASTSGVAEARAEDGSVVQEIGGGITGTVDGRRVALGNWTWVTQHLQEPTPQPPDAGPGMPLRDAHSTGAQQKLQVFVAVDKELAGMLSLSDTVRPEAAATVAALQREGFKTFLLTGDGAWNAEAVADAVGIPRSQVHSSVKPGGKAALVRELQARGRCVAMVGDGVNDASALAAADVGIAMGGGVDAASEAAAIVLLRDQLPQVVDALQLSRRTFSKIRQNLGWAFAYNAISLPLAAGALLPGLGIALTPSISGALMGCSSLAVMANSLLLQRDFPSLVKKTGES